MSELVVFPDFETALIAHVNDTLYARGISAEVADAKPPKRRPDRMVRISGTGGSRHNIVTDNPSALFECWAPNVLAACDLARAVRAVVDATNGTYIGDVWIEDVGTSTPVQFPDPDWDVPRYQFTAQIFTLGEVLS